MPKLNLKVPKALADDLQATALLGATALNSVASRLDAENACLFKPAELRKVIGEVVGTSDVPVVERVLMGLSMLRRQSDATVDDILDGLGRGAHQNGWDDDVIIRWEDIQPALGRLLNQRSVVVTAKAVHLIYDYDHFFVSAKILSDVRPVFDDIKNEIVGAAINHTLRMEFADASGKQTDISLVVDLDDIERIRKSCEEALNKGRILERQINDKWQIPTLSIDEIKNDRN